MLGASKNNSMFELLLLLLLFLLLLLLWSETIVICGFEDCGDAGGAVMELTDDPQLGVMEVIIGPAFVTPPQKKGGFLRGKMPQASPRD